MAYCEECGGLGEVCDDCVVGPLRDKIAALEAERDKLAEDYAQQVDKVNELAARLRAMLSSVNAVTAPWRHGCDIRTDKMDALCDRQVEVENGPVPECRACAGHDAAFDDALARLLKIYDLTGEPLDTPAEELWRNVVEQCDPATFPPLLARHAAEGGDHE